MSNETFIVHRRMDARQADVRSGILRAARQLIHEHGHEAVRMDTIAAAGGVSRATMYRYFASKEHVVCDAVLAWGQEVAARMPDAIAGAPDPVAAIDLAVEQIFHEATSDPPMLRATMDSVMAVGPVADGFRAGVRQMFTALMGDAAPTTDTALTVLGRVLFADLALLSVGDITVEQGIAELRFLAQRLLAGTTEEQANAVDEPVRPPRRARARKPQQH